MSRYFCVSFHSNFELYFETLCFLAVFLNQFYHSNRWTLLLHILRKISTLYHDFFPSRQTWQSQTSAWHIGSFSWDFQQLFKVNWHLTCTAVICGQPEQGTKGRLGLCFSLYVRVEATEIIEKPSRWVTRHRQDPLAF